MYSFHATTRSVAEKVSQSHPLQLQMLALQLGDGGCCHCRSTDPFPDTPRLCPPSARLHWDYCHSLLSDHFSVTQENCLTAALSCLIVVNCCQHANSAAVAVPKVSTSFLTLSSQSRHCRLKQSGHQKCRCRRQKNKSQTRLSTTSKLIGIITIVLYRGNKIVMLLVASRS